PPSPRAASRPKHRPAKRPLTALPNSQTLAALNQLVIVTMKQHCFPVLKTFGRIKFLLAALAGLALLSACVTTQSERGFVSLFDGQTLNGWKLIKPKGDGYGVTNGVIYCARGGGGNLFHEKE